MSRTEMDLIGEPPGETTTHAFGLRLGTWLIEADMLRAELDEAHGELVEAQNIRAPQQNVWVLQETIKELGNIRAHDGVFAQAYPDYEILGQQGCGDLTMNAWNVAYVNSPLAESAPALVCLPDEPLEYRTYSCLVKWKAIGNGRPRMSIEEMKFHRRGQVRGPNEMAWVRFGQMWLPRGDQIEFAMSNQQVIRAGDVVPAVAVCQQFGDLRHLIQMPNLNPDKPLERNEKPQQGASYRPRNYFNAEQYDDIWFGEQALLSDPLGNLRHAALEGPVFLEFPPGANESRLGGALRISGYREAQSLLRPLRSGEWRFVKKSPQKTLVEIFFKRNTYGWTMMGLSRDNRCLLWLACTGRPGQTGYTLEEAAELLRRAGADNALLMDEGADVFQKIRNPDGSSVDQVQSIRRRVRATFIAAGRQPTEAA